MAKNLKGIEVAEIISDKCIGCQICVAECPVGAIEMKGGVACIDPEICIGCGKCFEVCPVEAVRFEKERREDAVTKPEETQKDIYADYRGVAVFIEVWNGGGASVSWELTGKARELAGKLQTKVIGLLAGHEVDGVAGEAIAYGCDEVHIIDDPLLKVYLSRSYGKALSDLCQKVKPEIVLVGATPVGRDLASVVATTIGTGLTADCTGLDIDEEKRLLLMTRPTFGGNIMATIFCEHHRPQMSTVRPKVFALCPRDEGRKGDVHRYPLEPPHGELPEIVEFVRHVADEGTADITRFPALVVAGKGACDPESAPMLQELADVVGGVVACSRPVVEAGFMPYERQVGQTGKTVAPKLYFAIGVSGAVQHLVGMQGSEKIVAVNSDPSAPIFNIATAGILGDYRQVVPLLIEELRKKLKGG
ncbi:MAG: Acryloyl-CoA reductase electron transfer subunit beta [Syntrophorhabdus sp. PtaU1.Bin153]|nr:MAG: Acryloyl-CoA reductase electron transfer subunit beta [Syntrophorhabdus sp. PtaU1.Bin153]